MQTEVVKTESEFKDMSGDKVYDHFVKHCRAECEITGAKMIEHKNHSYYSPRKEIEIEVRDKKTKKTHRFKMNYKKMLEHIESL